MSRGVDSLVGGGREKEVGGNSGDPQKGIKSTPLYPYHLSPPPSPHTRNTRLGAVLEVRALSYVCRNRQGWELEKNERSCS